MVSADGKEQDCVGQGKGKKPSKGGNLQATTSVSLAQIWGTCIARDTASNGNAVTPTYAQAQLKHAHQSVTCEVAQSIGIVLVVVVLLHPIMM